MTPSSSGATRAAVVPKGSRAVEEELERPDISIINVVNALIECAYNLRGSDIHVDPDREEVRIRVRVDGVLQNVCSYPKSMHPEVVSRIKVIAELRTDEHNAPLCQGVFVSLLSTRYPRLVTIDEPPPDAY